MAAGRKLKDGLTQLERRLWIPYDVPGIQPETDVMSRVYYVGGYVTSSWAPPSPTHLEYLRQAEAAVNAALADFHRFFETEVAGFRQQADQKGLRLLTFTPVEVKRP